MQLTLDYANVYHLNYNFTKEEKEKLNQLFQSIEAKDLVYNNIKSIYSSLLDQQEENLSYQQLATIKTLQDRRVGNMSAITLLVNITKEIRELTKKEDRDEMVISTILHHLKNLEEKIKNRPIMEQADMYGNITTLTEISPELAETNLELLHTFSHKTLKDFSKEVFPLIISRLLLLKKDISEDKESRNHKPVYGYDPKDVSQVQSYLTKFLYDIRENQQSTSNQTIKSEVLASMSERIQKQFGLKVLPVEKLETNLKTIQNYMTYMANLSQHTPRDTKILGLFFGLQINDKWQDFRAGKEIDFSTIFEEENLNELGRYLYDRKEYSLFKGFDEDTQSKLQEDTISQRLGNVNTIDVELSAL